MEVEDRHAPLREVLVDSFSFRRNRVNYSIFYVASASTVIMFVILCTLSAWSVHIGHQISALVKEGHETLDYVQQILPDAEHALGILRVMCRHENFTRVWGNDTCPEW